MHEGSWVQSAGSHDHGAACYHPPQQGTGSVTRIPEKTNRRVMNAGREDGSVWEYGEGGPREIAVCWVDGLSERRR